MFKVWRRDFLVWFRYWPSSVIANLGEPFLYLVAMGFGLGRYVTSIDGKSYSEFIAPALVVASVMHSASFETTFSSYTRMAVQKTFDAIAVTPLSIRQIILGEILWATTKACIAAAAILLVLTLFSLVKTPVALLIFVVCFFEGLVFSGLGMLATATAKSYDLFNYYFTLFISPMFLFSGTFFPLKEPWMHWAASFLPLTHAVRAAREVFSGHLSWELFQSLACLMVMGGRPVFLR